MSKVIHLEQLSDSLKKLHCELINFSYSKHKEKASLLQNEERKLFEKAGLDYELNAAANTLKFLNVLQLQIDLPAFIVKHKREGFHVQLECPKNFKEKKTMRPIIISLQSSFSEQLSYKFKIEFALNDQYVGVKDNIYIRNFYEYLRKFLGVKDKYTKIKISNEQYKILKKLMV